MFANVPRLTARKASSHRHGRQDRPEGHEGVEVSLVNARRQDEEGKREDAHPEEDRQPIGSPGNQARHDGDANQEQGRAHRDGP